MTSLASTIDGSWSSSNEQENEKADNEQKKPKAHARINLALSGQAAKRLESLKKLTGASSNSEIIRNALRLYDFLIHEDIEGRTFCLRDTKGNLTECKIFY